MEDARAGRPHGCHLLPRGDSAEGGAAATAGGDEACLRHVLEDAGRRVSCGW